LKIFAFHNVVIVPRKSFKFLLPHSWLAKIRHTDIPRKNLIAAILPAVREGFIFISYLYSPSCSRG